MKPITQAELNESSEWIATKIGITKSLECDEDGNVTDEISVHDRLNIDERTICRRIAEILPQLVPREVAELLADALTSVSPHGGDLDPRLFVAALAAYEAWKKPEEK